MPGASEQVIVLFDGVCNFCNRAVQFLLRHDKQGNLRFAPLQSEKGRELLQRHQLPVDALETMVVVVDGRVFTRSDAGLQLTRYLGGPWSLLRAFRIVPRALRDSVYDLVARNRYRWFGRRDACMVPSPEQRSRFLF